MRLGAAWCEITKRLDLDLRVYYFLVHRRVGCSAQAVERSTRVGGVPHRAGASPLCLSIYRMIDGSKGRSIAMFQKGHDPRGACSNSCGRRRAC